MKILKTTIAALTLIVLIVAAACGGSAASNDTSGQPTSSTQPTASRDGGLNVQATVDAAGQAGGPEDGFKLTVGSNHITDDAGTFLNVTLIRVVEDSRCPEGTECVTAGSASVVIDVKSGGIPFGETTLTLEAGQTEPTIKSLGKYSVAFVALDPYPGTFTGEPEYEATLYVIRNR
ncbi:MAG: hypothetical protein FJ317_03195 [SAR202 cluster bacterium]|nr:hypothetical protein [SAR202 cluster bacterium]